jgi:Transposase IS66 family
MVFESKSITLYPIRARHHHEEVREVIVDNYEGTFCTDRGKSYDAEELAETQQQQCLTHILRSIDEVLETKRGPGRLFGEVLESQLPDAIGLYNAFHDPEKKLRDWSEQLSGR